MTTDDSKVSINIRCSNGSKFFVRAELNCTVGAFKSIIVDNCDVPVSQQRLIYKGRILKDEHTLESYGVQADHTVHLVRGSVPSPTTNPPNITPSEGPNVTANATRNTGTSDGEGLRATGIDGSLFSSFNGSLPTGLFPELGQMQQQLAQNPNMMRDIMNMPAVESILNNPDLLRSLIMSNPQMREVIDRNPEFGHALNDPSTLRQTLEAARNPEIMREIMRNTDRAMSNIEASPEGFNMLRRMYETVQEPFLNATSASRDVTNPGTNPFAALLGNQSMNQNTNRSSNPTTPLSETTADSLAPNTNPLPNPWSNTGGSSPANTTAPRPNATGGLGSLGLPQLQEVTGGLQDPSSLFNQMMQNPAFTQFMQSFLSNPQYMDQILSFNPQLRTMMDSNPQLRTLMQNPEFIRRVTSPETIQQYLSLHQMLTSQHGRNPPSSGQGQTGNDTGTTNLGFDLLRNMLGGVGAGGLGSGGLAVPNTSNIPPEELYATQLSQLQEMGFFDTQENIRALAATGGNVHAAVERLLGNFGQ